MNWLRELARRIDMLVHRRQFDADLEEEMRLHLALRQQEQLQAGVTPDDARAASMRQFGNATYLKEESRIAWGWRWLLGPWSSPLWRLSRLPCSPAICLRVVRPASTPSSPSATSDVAGTPGQRQVRTRYGDDPPRALKRSFGEDLWKQSSLRNTVAVRFLT
jgi:hypothetical protein